MSYFILALVFEFLLFSTTSGITETPLCKSLLKETQFSEQSNELLIENFAISFDLIYFWLSQLVVKSRFVLRSVNP